MNEPTDRRVLLRRMAWLCAALVLAITSLSAFLRLSKAGLGCEPWPQCHVQAFDEAAAAAGTRPPGAAVVAARLAHRVVASVALIVILVMVMTALTARPVPWREARLTLALLCLALFLAVLGRWSAQARLPAVTLGNLLGGLVMFALSCRLAVRPAAPQKIESGSTRGGVWASAAVAVLLMQCALGGMVSARHAGTSCSALFHCETAGASRAVFDPWHETVPPGRADAALVQGVHRAMVVIVGAVVVVAGVTAPRRARRAGAALIALWLIQAALGIGMVQAGLPMALALLHNVVAALLLAVAFGLASVRTASR